MNQDFWAEFENLLEPVAPVELEYRIYYNESGEIVRCSMQQHEPGDYLVVSKSEYDNYFLYTVANGQLKKKESDAGYRVQLRKGASGYPVVAGHANLLVEDEDYTDIEYYARTN